MTTPTPRWTAETEELLHRTLHDLDVRINNLTGDHHCNLVTQVALTALADAGVLTAVGGETRQEWGVRWADGDVDQPDGGRDGTVALHREATEHDGAIGHVMVRRDVVCVSSDWREVTDDPA